MEDKQVNAYARFLIKEGLENFEQALKKLNEKRLHDSVSCQKAFAHIKIAIEHGYNALRGNLR